MSSTRDRLQELEDARRFTGKAYEDLIERKKALSQRITKALAILDDHERLRAIQLDHERKFVAAFEQHQAKPPMSRVPRGTVLIAADPEWAFADQELPAFGRSAADVTLETFYKLGEELAAVLWVLANGLPKTSTCICRKCKTIILMYPSRGYYCPGCHLEQHYDRRYDKGLGMGFWDRYKFGDKFKGKLDSDIEEAQLRNSSP